jgi:hypothetical protein
MSAKVMMDVEVYLRTSFDGADCEYLDGSIRPKPRGAVCEVSEPRIPPLKFRSIALSI